MPWENIEERLKKTFTFQVSLLRGVVGFPAARLTIDEWLTSVADTDEELRELNLPRIRFLQNRWPIEKLVQFEWEDLSSSRCAVWVMYVGGCAYILFSAGSQYLVVAA